MPNQPSLADQMFANSQFSINTADRANTKLTSLASNNAIEAIDAASKDETNPR